jgi:hypothetical protein
MGMYNKGLDRRDPMAGASLGLDKKKITTTQPDEPSSKDNKVKRLRS